MILSEQEKPPVHEWVSIAETLVERLTTCVHTYSQPPYEDAFMADKERQNKNARALDLLRRIHKLGDDFEAAGETPPAGEDEKIIAGLHLLFTEALRFLPELSTDMQLLLKSPWHDHCNGRVANEFFRGRNGEFEGVGTGHPEHGRLPEAITNLLDREALGVTRAARKSSGSGVSGAIDAPERNSDEGPRRRWAESNSRPLRTAGRIE